MVYHNYMNLTQNGVLRRIVCSLLYLSKGANLRISNCVARTVSRKILFHKNNFIAQFEISRLALLPKIEKNYLNRVYYKFWLRQKSSAHDIWSVYGIHLVDHMHTCYINVRVANCDYLEWFHSGNMRILVIFALSGNKDVSGGSNMIEKDSNAYI